MLRRAWAAWAAVACGVLAACGGGDTGPGTTTTTGTTSTSGGPDTCGNGTIDAGEDCDDGNTDDGDGCSAACTVEAGYACVGAPSKCTGTCGDGIVLPSEACDDGNSTGGDGCSATCTVEDGFACHGAPSACAPDCRDGKIAGGEACDDGNSAGGDGCSAACGIETGFDCAGEPSICQSTCGDGVVAGDEDCDDQNTAAGDGCSDKCALEKGYQCTGAPSVCATVCGDGIVAGAETCDDKNTNAFDGCSATCTVEAGWDCSGSACVTTCGDGIKVGAEKCDDGNTVGGDCCSATCQVEPGCEVEANDTTATANEFAATGTSGKVKAFVGSDTDIDLFAVEIPAGRTGSITAETLDGPLGTTCASYDIDSYIRILDSAGVEIDHDEDSGTGYCSLLSLGSLPAGTYYVEVTMSPMASSTITSFDYTLAVTVGLCGDGTKDATESCDDGNNTDGDGCSSVCKIEGKPEAEPNDSCTSATGPYALGATNASVLLSGSINPAADADYFAITLSAYADLRVETFDSGGPGSCATIDTVVEAFGAGCASLGASDDEGGLSHCSRLDPATSGQAFMRHLAPGTYYVAVTPYSSTATFDYTVEARIVALCGNGVVEGSEQCDGGAGCQADCRIVPVCGDGIVSAGEQCDDHNTVSGDGCSSACKLETHPEIEPNATCADAAVAYAAAPVALFSGAISPAADEDFFAITLPTYTDLRVETFDGTGPGSCGSVDTKVQAFDSTCTALGPLDDDGGISSCSLLDPTDPSQAFMRHLAPGTYYIKVLPYSATATFNYMVEATAVAICGNGVVEGSEECDGGAGCQADCTIVPVCGDGILSAGEQCDDHNTVSGDGCSATCQLEATAEVEPNDTTAQADAAMAAITASTRLQGSLSSASDLDLYKLTVAAQTVVRFEIFDATFAGCNGADKMTLDLLSSTGATLHSAEAPGCPGLVVNLDPGTYYLQAGGSAAVPFYVLEVRYESNKGTEIEPNDAQGSATAESGTDFFVCGDHQTGADLDVYAVTVPAGKSIRAEVVEVATTAAGYETCESLGMDSYLTLYGPSFTSLATNEDGGRGYCSCIDGTGASPVNAGAHALAAGTYYVEVKKSGFATSGGAAFNYCLAVTVR